MEDVRYILPYYYSDGMKLRVNVGDKIIIIDPRNNKQHGGVILDVNLIHRPNQERDDTGEVYKFKIIIQNENNNKLKEYNQTLFFKDGGISFSEQDAISYSLSHPLSRSLGRSLEQRRKAKYRRIPGGALREDDAHRLFRIINPEWVIANKRLAFAMSIDERLGTDSPLNILPMDIFEKISHFLSIKRDISGGGKIKKYIFTRKKSKNKNKKSGKTRKSKSKQRKSRRRSKRRS
jgi:hypothetical protein